MIRSFFVLLTSFVLLVTTARADFSDCTGFKTAIIALSYVPGKRKIIQDNIQINQKSFQKVAAQKDLTAARTAISNLKFVIEQQSKYIPDFALSCIYKNLEDMDQAAENEDHQRFRILAKNAQKFVQQILVAR